MTLINTGGISKNFGSHDLFSGIDLALESHHRYALVGANGTGKSTLARILAGLESTTEGQIRTAAGTRIAYVPQHPDFSGLDTVMDVLMKPWQTLQDQLRSAEERLALAAEDRDIAAAMAEYQKARDAWDKIEGDELETRASAAMDALGLPGPPNRPLTGLSGGEAGLLALAAAVAVRPDLLILDEPGNHLDFSGLAWLEAYLSRYDGALLIISHNRYLMDRLCGTVLELENGRLSEYAGNYSDYRLTKLRDAAAHQATRKARLKNVERLEELVRRFEDIARRVADPAWGKRLRARRTQLASARDSLGEADVPGRDIKVQFAGERNRAEVAVRIQDYHKAFGETVLFEGAEAEIFSGEKVGLVGPNGCGKTTLLRDLLDQGDWNGADMTLRIGPSFIVGLMVQNFRPHDLNESLEDYVRRWGALSRDDAFALLSPLGFQWDHLQKTMGSLSGGELARVQLARLHYIRADLLILDEPTNHLDALSREAVEDALEDFSGTILAVSHDRYFLDKTVDRVIEVSNRRLISHPGGFSDWWADRGMATSAGRVTTRKKEKTRTPGRRGAGTPGISREQVADIESRIERLEAEKKDLESRMRKVLSRGDHQSARALGGKLDGSNKRLKEAWAIWEEVIQDS